jgi:hypothetical protein
MATGLPCTFRHYETISPSRSDTERRSADVQFPNAPCGGLGAPDPTLTPLSHSGYAQTGKPRPDTCMQHDSSAIAALNLGYPQRITGNASRPTATSQILHWTTNDAPSPAPRDLCAGDERPARRLSDAVPHPRAAAPGPADAGGVGVAAGPIGVGDAPGQREALSAAWHLHYLCDRCPLEWDEYATCEGPAWCPCCDEAVEPYDSVDLREDAA